MELVLNGRFYVVTGKKDDVRVLNDRRLSELQVRVSHMRCVKYEHTITVASRLRPDIIW